ncbi:hypothetical protein JCM11491_001529 [Sporobolomyces phaffii]
MLDAYLTRVHHAYTTSDTASLTSLLSPDPASPTFIQLRQHLLSTPRLRPTSYKVQVSSRFNLAPHRPFADYLSNHLLYVRDTPVPPCSLQDFDACCSLLEDLYKTADRLFATAENGLFVPTLRTLTSRLISVALAHGRSSRDANLTKAGEAARMLARPMGIAAADRSSAPVAGSTTPTKRSALYFLANSTFRVYFALKNLRLCDTVLNNVHNSTVSLEGVSGNANEFPKADRSTFWYYRGRINLYQRRLGSAKTDLTKSLRECHLSSSAGLKNARLILIYLITASLPLGYFPNYQILEHFQLHEQFGPSILEPLRKGNWARASEHLDQYRDWHLEHGNYLLLREKLEVVCWRNLARQTLLVSTGGQPIPATGPPTLSLALLLKSARIAWSTPSTSSHPGQNGVGPGRGVEDLDEDDIESIAVSLMDQGYIKAYIMHSKRLLVLQKGQHFGFPPLSSVG